MIIQPHVEEIYFLSFEQLLNETCFTSLDEEKWKHTIICL